MTVARASVHRLARSLGVRRFVDADRPAWLALRCAMDPRRGVAAHETAIAALLADRRAAAFLCTDRGDAPVGFVEAHVEHLDLGGGREPALRVDAMHIGPDVDRDAAASALLDALAERGAACGCRTLVFESALDDEDASALAAGHGFEQHAALVRWARPLAARAPSTRVVAPERRGSVPPVATEAPPGDRAEADAADPSPVESDPRPASADSVECAAIDPRAMPIAASIAAADPAAGPWRPGIGQLLILLAGAASFWFSDPWSRDLLYGAVLPLLDLVFVIYLIGLVAVVKYRKRTTHMLPGLHAVGSAAQAD